MNLFEQIRPSALSEAVKRQGTLAMQREIILQWVYNILAGLISLALPLIFIFFPDYIRPSMRVFFLLFCVGLLIVALNRKIAFFLRAFILIFFLQFIGAFAIYSNGVVNFGWMFLFASVLLSNLLLGYRYGIGFYILAIAAIVLLAVSNVAGLITNVASSLPDHTNASPWIVSGIIFLFTVSLALVSVIHVVRNLETTILTQERLTRELEAEQSQLEKRVEERSTDLKNRIAQFEVASQIAREISGEMKLESLLTITVNLIHDRFNFYHVGIFLNDDKNEYAVLHAATGEAGRQMLERNHRLKIGEIGLVGYTASHGEARIALNVASDAQHFKNPLLSETRSEMALPLRTGEQTIGALDVQSMLENAFSQEDVRILQTIADQLAIAVQKTRLVKEMQQTVEELESSYQITTQKAWRAHLRNARQKLAYHYRNNQLDQQVDETEHAQEALEQGKSILSRVEVDAQGQPVTVLAVPIKLRNQVLGVVDIHFESSNVSPDLISLIEGTVNRLAISLENARLMEEIQLRAERERMVSEISSKVRAASDIDSVLRIAVQELGKSLGVSEVMVQLRKES